MQKIDSILQSAQEKCANAGVKLTDKRQKILQIMIQSDVPLSPYEVVDQYNAAFDAKMPANSAYRILDFLAEENLAHNWLQPINTSLVRILPAIINTMCHNF